MMFRSLKTRIALALIILVLVPLIATNVFIEINAMTDLASQLERNSKNILESTKNHVISQHNSILYHKKTVLERRKLELKEHLLIAKDIVSYFFNQSQKKLISEHQAKLQTIQLLENLRYDRGIGYFWINDTQRPYPKMIMHPTMPQLDNNILNDPSFNCALGKNVNLFRAIVDISLAQGEGFIDYFWPKPTSQGLTAQQPKLSYVSLFKPWNWIIGTGVYIDDIEKEVHERLDAVISDLNVNLISPSLEEKSYLFIFNKDNKILVHPDITIITDSPISLPEQNILDKFKTAYGAHENSLDYSKKDPFKPQSVISMKAFITYYEPLGWYIVSTVSKDELNKRVWNKARTVILFSVIFLVITLLSAFLLSKSISKPLENLIDTIKSTDKAGIPKRIVPSFTISELSVLSVTINRMIMSIKQSQVELQQTQKYITNIIDSMPSVLVGVDQNLIITQWNIEAYRKTGFAPEEAIGQQLFSLIPDINISSEQLLEAIHKEKIFSRSRQQIQQHGNFLYHNITVYPLSSKDLKGAVIRIDDITEQVHIEEMMVQTEKMMSVGGLAAGIAHEINNPLAAMMQTIQVMQGRLTNLDIPANHEAAMALGIDVKAIATFMENRNIPNMLNRINDAGIRVSTIIQNMLNFARSSDSTLSQHDLVDIINQSIEFASSDYDLKKKYDFKDITIIKLFHAESLKIPCDANKIQQVMINLLRNAAQAMQSAHTSKPTITIETMRDAHTAIIKISDNGPGISEEQQKRIFEPFFTTKPVGEGTGLGLSVSYFIITENHKGQLLVSSSIDKGTTFTISLPLTLKQHRE